MTIYVFGDPDLLREALLALATIFNLVEWSDPGSAMGLGGNMLAVALIGLLAVAVAGVTSQQVRVDYLLVALILFGIGFSAKVDVNVEDIQTGDSRIVADIPIGIAMVASAASGAARNLTEVTSLAMQRPGATTSMITDDGFLDPLKHLLGLRALSFEDFDEYAYKSMLEFYRMCIGNTLATNPTLFNPNTFRRDVDPLAYMLTVGNFVNFSTVYYTEADPAGSAMDCNTAAGNLTARLDVLTDNSDEAIAKIRLTMGSKYYNTSFQFADLDDASDIISRGVFSGQSFMKAAAMRNFINVAEAWRLAEYGSNEAQYVATVTEALESKRVQDTTAGVVALQYFFPLMTFAQFLFFSIAPFVTLVLIASPYTSGKTLGMYLLFGVWAYSWMPVAAVINHYVQINIGNTLEFSDIGAVGVQYTALSGIDSLYDQLSNKMSIGGIALAASPVIVWALLTVSMGGITSMISKISGGVKANTSIGAPKLGDGRALVSAGGVASFREGVQLTEGGSVVTGSGEQRLVYGNAGASNAAAAGLSQARSVTESASRELETSANALQKTMESYTQSGGVFRSHGNNVQTQTLKSLSKALEGVVSAQELSRMSASQLNSMATEAGIRTPIFSTGQRTQDGTSVEGAYAKAMQSIKKDSAGFQTAFSEAMQATYTGQQNDTGALSESIDRVYKNQAELDRAQRAERQAQTQAQYVQQATQGFSANMVDVIQNAFASDPDSGNLAARTHAEVASIMGADYGKVLTLARAKHANNGRPVMGTDRRRDEFMDEVDDISTLAIALSDYVPKNANALPAYLSVLRNMGVVAGTSENVDLTGLQGAGQTVMTGAEIFEETEAVTGSFDPSAFGSRDGMSSMVQDPSGSGRIRERSRANREAGGQFHNVPESVQETMGGVFNESSNQVNGETLAGLSPKAQKMLADFNRMDAYSDATRYAIRDADKSLTQFGNDLWQGDSGFRKTLAATVPAAVNETDPIRKEAAVWNSLGALNGELLSQHNIDFRAAERYQGFVDQGFSQDEALLATYASVGSKQAGFGDYYMAVVGSVLGYKAGGAIANSEWAKAGKGPAITRSIGWARFGGAATTGVLALGAAYGLNSDIRGEQSENLNLMKDLYKQEFQMANPVMSEAFNKRVERSEDTADLVDAVMEFRERGELTDEMLASIEPQRGQAQGWEKPNHGGNRIF